MQHLNELERQGLMSWRSEEHAWVADPDRVVQALRDGGFQEYKREIAKDNRSHATSGGMWQGLDPQSGVVATVIWHATPQEAHVFVEIDGRPFEGNAWAEIDDAVLGALTEGGGRLTPGQIAKRVGMSEDAVRSVVSMLAEQGELDATSSRAGPGIVSPPRRRGVRVLGKPRLVGKRWQDNVEGAALRVVLRPEPALVRAHNRVTHR